MKVIEYGKENKEIIMLFHGGGLSYWNYDKEAELLKDKYHVILPMLGNRMGILTCSTAEMKTSLGC